MIDPLFVKPEEYTADMGSYAIVSRQEASRIQHIIDSQDKDIQDMKEILNIDSANGFIAEDIDDEDF
jgi:hypothetical protein